MSHADRDSGGHDDDLFVGEEFRYRVPWRFLLTAAFVMALAAAPAIHRDIAFFAPTPGPVDMGGLLGVALANLLLTLVAVVGLTFLFLLPRWVALARRGYVRLDGDGVFLRDGGGRERSLPWSDLRQVYAPAWPPGTAPRLVVLVTTSGAVPLGLTVERKQELVSSLMLRGGMTAKTSLAEAVVDDQALRPPSPGGQTSDRPPAVPAHETAAAAVRVLRYQRPSGLVSLALFVGMSLGAAFTYKLASGWIPAEEMTKTERYIALGMAALFGLAAVGVVASYFSTSRLSRRGSLRLDDHGLTLIDGHGRDTVVPWSSIARVGYDSVQEGGISAVRLETAAGTVRITCPVEGYGLLALGQMLAARAGVDTGLPNLGDAFKRPGQ